MANEIWWRGQIDPAPSTARIRVTRTIVYEGPKSWIVATLARAIVQGIGPALINLASGFTITCSDEQVVILTESQIAGESATEERKA